VLLPPKGQTGLAGLRDVLAGGTIAQSAVRMHVGVVCQPAWQLLDHRLRVGSGADADVVALALRPSRIGCFKLMRLLQEA